MNKVYKETPSSIPNLDREEKPTAINKSNAPYYESFFRNGKIRFC